MATTALGIALGAELLKPIAKFAVKKGTQLFGKGADWALEKAGKSEWKRPIGEFIKEGAHDVSKDVGKDNLFVVGAKNFSKGLLGEEPKTHENSLIPYEIPKQQAYLKNLGGSNYKRFRPSFKRMPLKTHKNSSEVISKKKPGKFSKKKPKRLAKKLNFKK